MSLIRNQLQPVGTSPSKYGVSGNKYASYGTKTTETDKNNDGQEAVGYGILGAMAGKAGYDWADKNGYIDKAKQKWFEHTTPNLSDPNAAQNGFSSANPMADFHAGDPTQMLAGPEQMGGFQQGLQEGIQGGMQAAQQSAQMAQSSAQAGEDLMKLMMMGS